jgi:hypothetical protein
MYVMKGLMARVMPIVMGAAIGWMLFHPPPYLAPIGAGGRVGPLRGFPVRASGGSVAWTSNTLSWYNKTRQS